MIKSLLEIDYTCIPKPANGVRLQAKLESENPTGLPVGVVRQWKTRITQEFTQEKSAAYATLFLSLTPFLSVISDTCPFSALGSCFQ